MNGESNCAQQSPAIHGRPGGLPWQNLLLAGVTIGCVSGTALWLNAQAGFPFGRGDLPEGVTRIVESGFYTGLVLTSVVSLLSARGIAKLLLLARRSTGRYGYWLLALNALLGTLPMIGWDLMTTRVAHCWYWENRDWHWEGIALPNLAGWLFVNVLALLLATPALIDKRSLLSPPGLRPVAVWFALNAVCLIGCRSRVSDAAMAILAAPVLVVTMLAFQGYRAALTDCGRAYGGE